MRDRLEKYEIEQRRNPEHDVKSKRAEKFREHDLPVAHGRGHERLDRAELKFLREKPHRDKRENQNEREPEEDRIEKSFLHRVSDRPLVHERNLKVEIDSADEQEKDKDDVGDGRVEVTPDFAREEGVEFTHGFGVMEWKATFGGRGG